MSKPVLIALLVALFAGLGALVWWQKRHFDQDLEKVNRKIQEDHERSQRNRPFVPAEQSSSPVRRGSLAPVFT